MQMQKACLLAVCQLWSKLYTHAPFIRGTVQTLNPEAVMPKSRHYSTSGDSGSHPKMEEELGLASSTQHPAPVGEPHKVKCLGHGRGSGSHVVSTVPVVTCPHPAPQLSQHFCKQSRIPLINSFSATIYQSWFLFLAIKNNAQWINNKVLLYSSGNYIQYPVINCNGKELKKNIYTHN